MLFKEVDVTWWKDENADKPVDLKITLRPWSGMKLLTLIGHVSEIGKLLGDDFALDGSMSAPRLATLVGECGALAIKNAAHLVAESIHKPKGLTADDVLAWNLEDFIDVLAEIIEINFQETTRKNYKRLRDVFAAKIFGRPPEAPRFAVVKPERDSKDSKDSKETAPAN